MLENIVRLQDREYVHEITRELSLMGSEGGSMGFRCGGSTGEWKAANRIAKEMSAIGLEDVAIEKFPVPAWEPLYAHLEIDGKKFPACPYAGTTGTPSGGLTCQIVDVGKGTIEDYKGKDVKDKFVYFTFDMLDDYWVSMPAYQARVMGAKGAICSYEGEHYSLREDSIGCFDSQSPHGFVTVNISRKSGTYLRDQLKKGEVRGTLDVQVKVDLAGESSNVIGYIPGKDPSKMILLAGHMDGFFNTYQDDVLGVGINLDIARSIIESGYKPEHTIAVVAHGSEEYGVENSHFDWCTGSWYNTRINHPEWFGKVVALLNIDAVRPDTKAYNIACTPEWKSFFEDFIMKMERPPEDVWPLGADITIPKGPWADGYNYSNLGVPEVICGGGPSIWSTLNYHTQFDNHTIYESERELIEYVTRNYTETLLEMDRLAFPPLDFSHTPENLLDTVNGMPKDLSKETVSLITAARRLIDSGKELYEKIRKANAPGYDKSQKDIQAIRQKLLASYRMVHRDLMRLAVDDSVVFPHEPMRDNIAAIDSALLALNGQAEGKIEDILRNFDLFWASYDFDEETYRFAMDCYDCTRDDLYWGTGKLHPFADTSLLSKAIKDEDKKTVTDHLIELRSKQIELLEKTVRDEAHLINTIAETIEEIEI